MSALMLTTPVDLAPDSLPRTPNPEPQTVVMAERIDPVCEAFGPYCAEAKRVMACESGGDVNAINGQYLGAFQMGESERATYGHGPTLTEQARAAARYFTASGSDWSPWACKP